MHTHTHPHHPTTHPPTHPPSQRTSTSRWRQWTHAKTGLVYQRQQLGLHHPLLVAQENGWHRLTHLLTPTTASLYEVPKSAAPCGGGRRVVAHGSSSRADRQKPTPAQKRQDGLGKKGHGRNTTCMPFQMVGTSDPHAAARLHGASPYRPTTRPYTHTTHSG